MTALSDKKTEWQPSASIKNLLARAKIIADIRQFFTERGLLEVETPVLSEFGVTDLHLSTFNTEFVAPFDELSKTLWLSTSPEYHMKRLLAAGSGPIFQIGKVFRNEEAGNRHNPEFTMLEWYRPHFDMYRLMNEVDDLLQQILDCKPAETLSYQFVFQEYVGLDPLSATRQELVEAARKHNFMADEDVAAEAKKNGSTRAVASMDKAANLFGDGTRPCIFAIGNAPTALIRLYELIQERKIKPALIIGAPVGFVNVIQSKELILSLKDTPYIVAEGRKGGSNVAAAICNALLYGIK